MEIISRDEARKHGLKQHFTGEPCSRGHVAPRYTCDGQCFICAKEKLNKRREAKRQAEGRPSPGRLRAAREQALAAGQTTFWVDWPCKHGHIAPRRVENGGCCECGRLSRQTFYQGHKEYFQRQGTAWRANNPEAARAIRARHEAKDPERHAERKRRSAVTYYYAHKDQRKDDQAYIISNRVARRKWRDANPAADVASKRKYRRANPEKGRAHVHTRRGRILAAGGQWTEEDILTALERQGYRCAAPHCRADVLRNYDCDHIIPLSRGGTNGPENLQILCPTCNRQKGPRTMEEWLADRPRHDAEAEFVRSLRLRRLKKTG